MFVPGKIFHLPSAQTFLKFENVINDIENCDKFVINFYQITLHGEVIKNTIGKNTFDMFVDTNKPIIIDGTYEPLDIKILEFLNQYDNLEHITYITNPPLCHPGELDDKISILKNKGLNIQIRHLFLENSYLYKPRFTDIDLPHKTFLCLTGKTKPYRTAMVSYLSYHNLVDYGYVSLFGEDYTQKEFYHGKIEDVFPLASNENQRDILSQGLSKITLPLSLDVDIIDRETSHEQNFLGDYYKCVDYVIVCETIVRDYFFITEKTIKAINMNKKILVLASKNFVSNIKTLYKDILNKDISHLTDWCDLSYDEYEGLERIEKMIEIVKESVNNK